MGGCSRDWGGGGKAHNPVVDTRAGGRVGVWRKLARYRGGKVVRSRILHMIWNLKPVELLKYKYLKSSEIPACSNFNTTTTAQNRLNTHPDGSTYTH